MNLKITNQNAKITLPLLLAALCLSTLAGCRTPQQNDAAQSTVTLLNTDKFPEHMIGTWDNDQYGWILRFEEDGRLSRIRHTIGRTNLKAGQRSVFPLINEGKGFMQPGKWHVEYLANTKEIVIDISIRSFKFEVPDQGIVKGSSRDIFIGKMPKSGKDSWRLQWISKPQFLASTPDQEYKNYPLPIEADGEDKGVIIFKKKKLDTL